MEYTYATWLLLGKRKMKKLLKRGPLNELVEMINECQQASLKYGYTQSYEDLFSKKLLHPYDLLNYLNNAGEFNGNKNIIVAPRIQDFLNQHGIDWEQSLTAPEIAQVKKFREFTSTMNKKDVAILGVTLNTIQIPTADIFDENNDINSQFFDILFSRAFQAFSPSCVLPRYSSIFDTFSENFISKNYGPEIVNFVQKYDYENNPLSVIVERLIAKGLINKNNLGEVLSIENKRIALKDKFFEIVDHFEIIEYKNACVDDEGKNIFIDENGNIIPELAIHLTDVEKILFKLNNHNCYISRLFIGDDEEIDLNKVFRLSKNGKIMLNEEYFKEIKDKLSYVNFFNFISNEDNLSAIDEYDFEKLGISKDMFLTLIRISQNNYWVGESLLIKILKENELLTLDEQKAKDLEKIVNSLIKHIENSNSKELNRFSNEILCQIINNPENYEEKISKIEDIFIHNNLPEMSKRFLIYKIMYPQYPFSGTETMSPTLTYSNDTRRDMIILSDLIRTAAESNNISLKNYLDNIESGNALYLLITSGEVNIDNLDDDNKKIITDFLKHLETVYNQTTQGKKENVTLTGNLKADLDKMYSLFGPTQRYDLPDRIVRMFSIFAGIKSFKELKDMIDTSTKKADLRGRKYAEEGIVVKKGDFLKGIGDAQYLYDILQNGSVSKEFLGVNTPGSDNTPLDTDVTRIGTNSKLKSQIDQSYSSDWGPIWFIIKDDGRFTNTRQKAHENTTNKCYGKEVFHTSTEWGIRTGFGSTDIDYIIIDQKIDKRDLKSQDKNAFEKEKASLSDTKFAIILNGFYIPVYDKNTGNLLFTPKEYDMIRNKMFGLKRYGMKEFNFSPNLDDVPDYDNAALITDATEKRTHINKFIEKVMKERGLRFSPKQSDDLVLGGIDLIDTGSTGRGTNIELSSDFDFIMRIDSKEDQIELSKAICNALGLDYEKEQKDGNILVNGNLRLKGINVPGIETPIDMDISYIKKDEMDFYSTDECLKDRLKSIKQQNPDKYQRILDNIIYAKKVLKENKCYKPSHAPNSQGGLGGVGIENWVLQNGGSFTDACRSFLDKALTKDGRILSFEEFKKVYKVYDFGRNFYGKNFDEFVTNNMTKEGYDRMVKACRNHLKSLKEKEKSKNISKESTTYYVEETNSYKKR